MEEICGSEKSYLETDLLLSEHLRVKEKALERFVKQPKFGGTETCQKYKEELEKVFFLIFKNQENNL